MFSFKSKSATLKDGILDQIGEQIKALQLGKQNAEEEGLTDFKVTSDNIHLQCLLDLLDHVMLHGLENVEHGYWPYVINLTHSATIDLISNHPQVTNDLDKGRVWVFIALCDGLLESYIRLFLEEQKEVKKFYTRHSFLRDKERLLVLQTLVSGLDFVNFDLHLSYPYLGYGGLLSPSIQVTSPSSSKSTSPRMSSSSSTLVGSPSNSDELTDKHPCDVDNLHSNGHLKGSPKSNMNTTLHQLIKYDKDTKKVVGNDRSLSAEIEQLTLMDPRNAKVDEDSTRALTNAAYSDIMNDYRFRGDSNASTDVSMDEPLVNRTYIRSNRKKKTKQRARSDPKQAEHHYPTPDDKEHSVDYEDFNDSKDTRHFTSYLSDYRRDVDSESLGSAVSRDSLDQFCRDTDFGSSLHLEGSPQVKECVNEQPTFVKENFEKTENKEESAAVLDNASLEYEGIIMSLPKRPSLQDMPGTDCDVSLDTNTLLLLSLEIYKNNEEQFHRMLRTSTGHQFGQMQCAHVMVTDFAVYLLRKVKFREEASFHTDLYIEFSNIKSIEIGLNCQMVTVRAKKETFLISFGDEAVSRSFITSLTSQMARASPSLSLSNLVSSSALQQEATLTKWMAKDKQLNMSSPNISNFSLVHWCGLTGRDSIIEVISYQSVMEGTLEFRSQNLLRSSRWTEGYFVLTNGTLWQYLNQNDKTARNMIDLRESRCGGCRQLHDADRKFAFEIVSSDGTGSLLVLAAKTEHEACEWIFKICQSIAESYDDETDRGCTVMKCVPSNLITTKEKIVVCLAQPNNENEYKLITSCALQNITKIYVDNEIRNYCILKFEYNEIGGSEGSWFISFNSEFELGKFEHSLAEAWRELFQVDLQFLVLGNNESRDQARERVTIITQYASQ